MSKKNKGLAIVFILVLFSLLIILLPSFSSQQSGQIAINRTIDLPLINQHKEETLLVFFGYSGCIDICMPRLKQIASWYETLNDAQKKRTTFLFFDLSLPIDKKTPDRFAKSFHKEFHGFYLSRQHLNNYASAFDVYYAQSLFNTNEIDHTPHLYLLKRARDKYYLQTIYITYPYNLLQVSTDLENSISE